MLGRGVVELVWQPLLLSFSSHRRSSTGEVSLCRYGAASQKPKMEDTREDRQKIREAGATQDSVGRAVESDTRRQSVDEESLVSRRMMPTAEEVEDNLSQRRMEKSEECGSWGMWWKSRKRKKARAARVANPR